MRIVGISGGLSSPSRTLGLLDAIAGRLEQRTGATVRQYDLAGVATLVGGVLDYRQLPAHALSMFNDIVEADVLVVAAPVFKAAYPGLFKHVFDLLDRDALQGKVAILGANGGSAHHALMIESHLRPLLSSLGCVHHAHRCL